jgi:hypothetical protein
MESSNRVISGELGTLEPFLALQLDVAAGEAMAKNYDAELRKPMSEFTNEKHMAMFGRPLWRAYQGTPNKLRIIAKQKIACSEIYNSKDTNQMFAAVASRLCLDVCMGTPEAMNLAHRAVDSHLRIVLRMDSPQMANDSKLRPSRHSPMFHPTVDKKGRTSLEHMEQLHRRSPLLPRQSPSCSVRIKIGLMAS